MDAAEAYGPMRKQLWQVALMTGALLFGAGASMALVWRQQSLRFYRERAEKTEALHISEAGYRRLNAELEQRVAERTAQLQTANQELEAFSYSVSHDLRAPLRHVMGFIELLQKEAGPSLSEKGLRHLTTISQAAKQMGQLIDDLLAFSRVARVALHKTGVNLDELVQETLDDFLADAKGRTIVWQIHPLPAVRADRALLRLALVNLISNAVKFTGARAEAKIEIGCAPVTNGETVIFVRDNGAGFDPRYSHKLFGVFQRLHSSAEFEGTGIGLANVQRIISRHGGRTWAEGVVEGGATFYFSIPNQNGEINGH
jgi:light-regulated signal transduction histidine kinase (bacteriophytochrome)